MPLFKHPEQPADNPDELTDEDLALMARLKHAPAPDPLSLGTSDDIYLGIATIRDHDPAFDMHKFIAAVAAVYELVRQSWVGNTPQRVTPLLDPTLQHRWTDVWASWQVWPAARMFESMNTPEFRPLSISSDPTKDVIDLVLSLTSAPGTDQITLRQRWTYVNYHVADLTQGRVVERRCPHCGGPYSVDAEQHCTFCGAVLTDLTFSWKVVDITDH